MAVAAGLGILVVTTYMVLEFCHLGEMEFGLTVLTASHDDVVAGLRFYPSSWAMVGFVRVDAVSSFADGYSHPWENFWIRSCEVNDRFLNDP
jgi:hypothetical protein